MNPNRRRSMTILLNDILAITAPNQYKLHLACRTSEGLEPLDEFVGHPGSWIGWNECKGAKRRPAPGTRIVKDFTAHGPRPVCSISSATCRSTPGTKSRKRGWTVCTLKPLPN